jgi:hypothetical protein
MDERREPDSGLEPDPDLVESRATALLPEEAAAGSDDPEAQAAAVLEESEERTLDPEPVEQRASEDTVEPT